MPPAGPGIAAWPRPRRDRGCGRELIAAIRTVAAGDAVVAPRVTRRLLEVFADRLPVATATADPARPDQRLTRLTERERDVLDELVLGLSNLEVAAKLFLSEATVKTHVGRILTKLELRDRVQAVIYACETGLVDVNSVMRALQESVGPPKISL